MSAGAAADGGDGSGNERGGDHDAVDKSDGAGPGAPASWREVILQGPHLFVATPMYKAPNKTMLHNQDWSATDFEALPPDAVPVTAYKPAGDRHRYDRDYTHWGDRERRPARDYYRVAWRRMAANTGERTLTPAIIPPGCSHVNTVRSAGGPDGPVGDLIASCAMASSIVADMLVRAVPKNDIIESTFLRLPLPSSTRLSSPLSHRVLRLNCITDAYADLWAQAFDGRMQEDSWTGGIDRPGRPLLGEAGPVWTWDTPLRVAADRRQALVEIDALVSLTLGLTADELCTIYRTQFAVLYGYDRNVYYYDLNGRLVPNSVLSLWRKKGNRITDEERTATNQAGNTYTYELPFVTLDREADMRQAYAHFEERLKERS